MSAIETPVRITTFREATAVLKETLPGYEERPEQEALATKIEQSWADNRILVGQAGTGTGKSLAALIPSILSGERVIYSTATKALQEQVMQKDLPFLDENLGIDFRYAMLQGMGNYFCHAEASKEMNNEPLVRTMWDSITEDDQLGVPQLTGLRADFNLEMDDRTWRMVTTTSDDCTKKKCPFYDSCRFMKAKDDAMKADVVVVNHALVALDARIRETTLMSFVLGTYDHLILDEAHEFEEFVTMALTERITQGTFVSLGNDLKSMAYKYGLDGTDDAAIQIPLLSASIFSTWNEEGRIMHSDAIQHGNVVADVIEQLSVARDELMATPDHKADSIKELSLLTKARARTSNLIGALTDFLLKPDAEIVRMTEIESGRKYPIVIKTVPVHVGPWIATNIWAHTLPVLVSATILVDGKPHFIADRLGFTDEVKAGEVNTIDVGSPFDFDKNSLLYIPEDLEMPSGRTRDIWEEQARGRMLQLIEASRGRALVLFTSRKAMETAFAWIEPQVSYECKKQGDLPNSTLTTWFRDNTESVLFATRSFFTGIDIQGEALSTVIIDKLPFPVPTEPVFEARSEQIKNRGGSDFMELSVPVMTLVLQQAFGRLIRTKKDRGVVAILDPRLSVKAYGKVIRRSLPGPDTYDLNKVDEFWNGMS